MFWLSSTPGSDLPAIDIPYLDKVVHATEFLIFGSLVARAYVISSSGSSLTRIVVVPFCLAAVYAYLDEWHQQFIPGRMVDAADLFADFSGILVGIFLYLFLIRKRKEMQRGSDKAF